MKKRVLAVLMAAAMTLGMLTGCGLGSETPSSTGNEETGGEYIGMIFPALSSEMMVSTAETMQKSLEAEGHKVEVVSSDNDAAKEKQQLETFASMGVDRVLIFPMGATAGELGSSLQSLREQGIKVYVMGNRVEEGCFDGELIVDNARVGEMTAQLTAEWIEETFPDAEEGSVKIGLVVTTASTEAKAQSDALYEVEEMTSKAKIVEVYDQSFSDANSLVQDNVEIMLEKHPDLKAVMTYSEIQATTVNETIMSHAEINKSEFAVFGSGLSQTSGDLIKSSAENESVLRGSVYYNDPQMAVDLILDKVELDEDNKVFYVVEGVTAENVDEYMK